jgi:hypothetical protein
MVRNTRNPIKGAATLDSQIGDPDQKRRHDRARRSRQTKFHHLYKPYPSASQKVCFYCKKRPAATQDHCPSLLLLDFLGVDYFARHAIPLLLIPACMRCNNEKGTAHVWLNGRVVELDWNDIFREWRGAMPNGQSVRGKAAPPKKEATWLGAHEHEIMPVEDPLESLAEIHSPAPRRECLMGTLADAHATSAAAVVSSV